MKAIICTKYGSPDVLQFQEVAKPAPRMISNPDLLRDATNIDVFVLAQISA